MDRFSPSNPFYTPRKVAKFWKIFAPRIAPLRIRGFRGLREGKGARIQHLVCGKVLPAVFRKTPGRYQRSEHEDYRELRIRLDGLI
jgi:hypothetical protein